MILQLENWVRYILNVTTPGNIHDFNKKEFKLINKDNFSDYNYDLNKLHYKYRTDFPWGSVHPRNTIQYFNDKNVFLGEGVFSNPNDKSLVITTKYEPRFIDNIKPWPYESTRFRNEIPYSVGMIHSKDSWKYGFFKVQAKLPKGSGLWPAIWLTGDKNWPPEIDILEGYSNDRGKYGRKLESNLHYKLTNIKDAAGAQKHPLRLDPTENYINYVLWWEPNFIRIYYNGYLVRSITDKLILDYFSQEKMHLIISTGVRKSHTDNITPYSQMLIKNIEIYQRESYETSISKS